MTHPFHLPVFVPIGDSRVKLKNVKSFVFYDTCRITLNGVWIKTAHFGFELEVQR
jgi:hypothetical protein